MSEDKIDYRDIKEYESLFKLAPTFLLESFARRNSNIVQKFKPKIESHINNLNQNQRNKLDIILNSQIEELQSVLAEAYKKTRIKQYKILANPKYRQFIETNLNEIRKLL